MSLSDKLNKNSIQIKKKNQGGGNDKKLSPMSQNYKKYLQGGSNDKKENDTPKNNSGKKINLVRKKGDPDIKIIHKKGKNDKYKKNKHKFTRKKPSKIKIKDINEIEKQIKLHNKHCNIFKNNMMVPELFSYGDTINIPFSDKKGKFKYMIMESINNPTELSDYIQKNCKSNKDKNINSYNLALQIFYYLAMINKNKVRHCDIHTKNILIIKSKKNLVLDFSFINGGKINVGKYNIKIIDFGISEINKNCKRNRRFIGAVLNDIKACNAFNKKDVIHIKKDMTSMLLSSFSKKFRPDYYINEDLYIFVKILRLLNLITDKLNKTKIDNIQYSIKHNEKGLLEKIYNILVT